VTRNKLTFRDNLSLLLESGSPTDRALEKRLKEWLVKCHKELDRTIKFEALCSQPVQVGAGCVARSRPSQHSLSICLQGSCAIAAEEWCLATDLADSV
jgi:hypothetical protein